VKNQLDHGEESGRTSEPPHAANAMFAATLGVGGPTQRYLRTSWSGIHPAIEYRVEVGLSQKLIARPVVIDNAQGVTRVNSLFANWLTVQQASMNPTNLGGLLAVEFFPANGQWRPHRTSSRWRATSLRQGPDQTPAMAADKAHSFRF